MLDLLDFREFLRRREVVRAASDAEIRTIAREDRISAWKFNVTESLLAGVPAAILTFIIGGVLFSQPRLENYEFEQQLQIVAMGNASIASAWMLPIITFGLALAVTFVFVLGLPKTRGRFGLARRVYLLVEGAHGLAPQMVLVAGAALALPAVQLIASLGLDFENLENLGSLEWSRVHILAAVLLATGVGLSLVGGVWSFVVNGLYVPSVVARICGAKRGGGVAGRVFGHAIASLFAGYLIGALAFAAVYGFGYGTAFVFLSIRQWLLAG